MTTCGDTGLILGGWYVAGDRRMLCMVDHADNGIWLTDPLVPVALTRTEDRLLGGNWYGTREEFDAAGWQLDRTA
jgi:hypothetical protein